MLRVSNISAGYGRVTILENVSIEVGQGEVVTIIGSNGAGKTTLLRAISGLITPSTGEIVFDGQRVDHRSPADIVGRSLIMVPEAGSRCARHQRDRRRRRADGGRRCLGAPPGRHR